MNRVELPSLHKGVTHSLGSGQSNHGCGVRLQVPVVAGSSLVPGIDATWHFLEASCALGRPPQWTVRASMCVLAGQRPSAVYIYFPPAVLASHVAIIQNHNTTNLARRSESALPSHHQSSTNVSTIHCVSSRAWDTDACGQYHNNNQHVLPPHHCCHVRGIRGPSHRSTSEDHIG